jgi:hypothetical protein
VAEGSGNGGWERRRSCGRTRRRPRFERGRHGGAVVRTVWLTSGAHTVSYFSKLFKLAETWKLKIDVLACSKISQFLHVPRLGHFEQFPQLCRHPILNRIRVKNHGTDSTFESLMNFKMDLNPLKNLINSPKFLLDFIFTKVNLVGITCMQDIELQYKCQTTWFE